MRQSPAGAFFFAGWVGLLGIITWKAQHNPYPNPPYWSTVAVLVALVVGFLLLWRYNYPYMLRVPLVLGLVWLVMLPFTPPIADIALEIKASQIEIGMTEPQVRRIMAGYRSGGSGFAHADGIVGVSFCTDDLLCETSAQVEFASGRVVSAWVDTD